MPQNKYALARYYLIHSLLQKHTYVKTSFIVNYCIEKTGYTVTQRTIQMDMDSMKNDTFLGFYAPIGYCNRRKAYYYTQPNYEMIPFRLKESEIKVLEELLKNIDQNVNMDQYYVVERIIRLMKFFTID